MKIRLLRPFRGSITDERFYEAGEYEGGVNMPLPHAQALVDDNRAEVVKAKTKRKAKTKKAD